VANRPYPPQRVLFMVVLTALPLALLCVLIALMCLRRGYRRHAVVLALTSAILVAGAAAIVAVSWLWWQKLAVHFG